LIALSSYYYKGYPSTPAQANRRTTQAVFALSAGLTDDELSLLPLEKALFFQFF
jgi:hypothetical protein